jgi:hypothetical protein
MLADGCIPRDGTTHRVMGPHRQKWTHQGLGPKKSGFEAENQDFLRMKKMLADGCIPCGGPIVAAAACRGGTSLQQGSHESSIGETVDCHV